MLGKRALGGDLPCVTNYQKINDGLRDPPPPAVPSHQSRSHTALVVGLQRFFGIAANECRTHVIRDRFLSQKVSFQ